MSCDFQFVINCKPCAIQRQRYIVCSVQLLGLSLRENFTITFAVNLHAAFTGSLVYSRYDHPSFYRPITQQPQSCLGCAFTKYTQTIIYYTLRLFSSKTLRQFLLDSVTSCFYRAVHSFIHYRTLQLGNTAAPLVLIQRIDLFHFSLCSHIENSENSPQ